MVLVLVPEIPLAGCGYNSRACTPPQLLDHFQNPRNAGEVADADATAEIENPACGDVLRLTLKAQRRQDFARRDSKPKDASRPSPVRSALTELIMNETPEEARNLRREDVIAAVGGLPQASTHAAQLAMDALSRPASRQISAYVKLDAEWPPTTRRAALPACSPARPSSFPRSASSIVSSPAPGIAPTWFRTLP